MPVFTRIRDGVLVVTVDGDYTSDGLRRAGERGLESDDVPTPVAVLLDMSGSAGVGKKSSDDLRQTGEFFGQRRELITRVAVLAPSDVVYGLMNIGSVFATAARVPTRPFRDRGEAMEWLREGDG